MLGYDWASVAEETRFGDNTARERHTVDFQQLLFPVALLAIFYFLLIRPQQQRQKAQREMMNALSVGDEILTVGGIYATVVDVAERLRVRVVDGTEIEIARQAVASVVSRAADAGDSESTVDADDEADTAEASLEGDE